MSLRIQEDVVIAPYTTFKIGGRAQYFCEVSSIEELQAAEIFAQQRSLPLCILGGGSNVLAGDVGFSGLVVRVALFGLEYTAVGDDLVEVRVGAGVLFDEVVEQSVLEGLWGLENLSHIPGCVGATPVQNVGAYGVEVSQLITAVHTYHLETQSIKVFTNDECKFSYRDSFFKTPAGKKYVVTAVTFTLRKNSRANCSYADLSRYFLSKEAKDISLSEVRAAVIAIRSEKFPDWNVVGTAGSFFKNPLITRAESDALRVRYPELPLYEVDSTTVKCSLGYILDKVCGLKGFRVGKVRLYEKQALVVVTELGATAEAVEDFVKIITEKVFLHTGITIEREVNYLFE